MFTLSLIDPNSKKSPSQRLNSSDELPLYAECIDNALNENARLAAAVVAAPDTVTTDSSHIEYIRINMEWRSIDDISKCLILIVCDSNKEFFLI